MLNFCFNFFTKGRVKKIAGLGVTSNQPQVQNVGRSTVGGDTASDHSVQSADNRNRIDSEATVPRTKFTTLKERMVEVLTSMTHAVKNFFTRTITPTPTVTITKTISKPASPHAASAGYQTAHLMVGETPLRIYAKENKILDEIGHLLSKPGLLSDDEMVSQCETIYENLITLGFPESVGALMNGGISMCAGNIQGYVEGNEEKRNNNPDIPFQSCQLPDSARIVGAKVLVSINSLLQNIRNQAKICKRENNEAQQIESRKQIMDELLNICNNPDLQITTLEVCVGGIVHPPFQAGNTIHHLVEQSLH